MTPEQQRAVAAETPSHDQWKLILDLPMGKRGWLSDEEAEAVAVTTARRLRAFQANGLIRAAQASTGGAGVGRRMWRPAAVYLAAVASEVSQLVGWSIPQTAAVLRVLLRHERSVASPAEIIQPLIVDSLDGDDVDIDVDINDPMLKVVARTDLDWFLSVCDGKFILLTVPEGREKELCAITTEFPICAMSENNMVPIIYASEEPDTFAKLVAWQGQEETERQRQEVEFVRSTVVHSRAILRLNISMPIRAAARRMRGIKVQYAADICDRLLLGNWAQSKKERGEKDHDG